MQKINYFKKTGFKLSILSIQKNKKTQMSLISK